MKKDSVLFWVTQTVMGLEELLKDKPDCAVVKTIIANFTTYLIDMVQKSSCYLDWRQFAGIFPPTRADWRWCVG